MKKTILFCGLAAILATACKKDRTCTCTTTSTTNASIVFGGSTYVINETATETEKKEVKKTTKSNALANDCASMVSSGPVTFNSTQTSTLGTSTDVYSGTMTQKVDCNLD